MSMLMMMHNGFDDDNEYVSVCLSASYFGSSVITRVICVKLHERRSLAFYVDFRSGIISLELTLFYNQYGYIINHGDETSSSLPSPSLPLPRSPYYHFCFLQESVGHFYCAL